VSETEDGETLLVGEAKWSGKPFQTRELERLAHDVAARPLPKLPQRNGVRAIFVPVAASGGPRKIGRVHVVTGAQLL
jgi:hypothetical protein